MDRCQAEVLVEESGPLVRWVIARSFRCFIRRWFDEMYSVGLESVWHAAINYKPSGKTWASWASTRIYWDIVAYLRTATGGRLTKNSIKKIVSLQTVIGQEEGHDWLDPKQGDPGRALELQEMLSRLQRRLGRDYILLEGVLEDTSMAESARQMGICEGAAYTRRKKLFARIRSGYHGNVIEVIA